MWKNSNKTKLLPLKNMSPGIINRKVFKFNLKFALKSCRHCRLTSIVAGFCSKNIHRKKHLHQNIIWNWNRLPNLKSLCRLISRSSKKYFQIFCSNVRHRHWYSTPDIQCLLVFLTWRIRFVNPFSVVQRCHLLFALLTLKIDWHRFLNNVDFQLEILHGNSFESIYNDFVKINFNFKVNEYQSNIACIFLSFTHHLMCILLAQWLQWEW